MVLPSGLEVRSDPIADLGEASRVLRLGWPVPGAVLEREEEACGRGQIVVLPDGSGIELREHLLRSSTT